MLLKLFSYKQIFSFGFTGRFTGRRQTQRLVSFRPPGWRRLRSRHLQPCERRSDRGGGRAAAGAEQGEVTCRNKRGLLFFGCWVFVGFLFGEKAKGLVLSTKGLLFFRGVITVLKVL